MKSSWRAALCFVNYGPYHRARLEACKAHGLSIDGLQLAPLQSEYQWQPDDSENILSVFSGRLESIGPRQWPAHVFSILDRLNPDLCFVAGYGHPGMRAILSWCEKRKRPAVMMSDSRFEDEPRRPWKEWLKTLIVKQCSAGLVAGTPHVAYLKSLGMPEARIFKGYDVVDNDYFTQAASKVKTQREPLGTKYGLDSNYFLISARFVEKKNLLRLLEAYVKYRTLSLKPDGEQSVTRRPETSLCPLPWRLVLLGDGPLKPDLLRLISELQLESFVTLPGFIQYDELPVYYGLARAFIFTSTTDQWGLVVNEAMASGLPVLVSKGGGCATDLVHEGKNGFTFDPYNVDELAQLMLKISATDFPLSEFGLASQRIIAEWGLKRFAQGLQAAAEVAFQVGPSRTPWFHRLLLNMVLHR
ncbi:glycosyltransferase [Methylacidiphilales bacterium]|nr:glycosyltransferase [Candidatus Methylacidiphilales bacterium]